MLFLLSASSSDASLRGFTALELSGLSLCTLQSLSVAEHIAENFFVDAPMLRDREMLEHLLPDPTEPANVVASMREQIV
jgi:hypothetical protein